MFRAPSIYALHFLLVAAATALRLPLDLSNAIVQSAHLLNDTHIPIANITQANPGYNSMSSTDSEPDMNLGALKSPFNDTLLKNTQVRCSRPAYGTVTYPSCFNALNTFAVRPSHVYTVGQRDAGLFDINLPFRLIGSTVSFRNLSSKPTVITMPFTFVAHKAESDVLYA